MIAISDAFKYKRHLKKRVVSPVCFSNLSYQPLRLIFSYSMHIMPVQRGLEFSVKRVDLKCSEPTFQTLCKTYSHSERIVRLVVKDAPHITLSMGRYSDGENTTGDIGALGLGFGIFQAWLYMAVFSVIRIFEPSILTGFNFYLTESMAYSILYSFLASSAITLICIGASNQRYLRFYVSKLAMWLGASLCSLGTLAAFLACVPFSPEASAELGAALADTSSISSNMDPLLIENLGMFEDDSTPLSWIASFVSGISMGIGSSLLVALWGTGFARCRFTTIVLNAAISFPLGVIVAFLLTIWIPSPFAGVVTACLPFLAILFLQILTPMPFYQRHEKPIFDPFPAHRISYIVRIGIPTVIFGIVLGVLRAICVGQVLPSGNITIQLVLGAACALSIVLFVVAIAIARRNPYWDTLFRNLVSVIVIGSVSIPFITGEYAVPSGFLISLGYICLEVLMWVFFADLSNRFSLSPLFVFGLGRGILEVAGILGSALATWGFYGSIPGISGGLTVLALISATLMSIGYSVLPRYREFKSIVEENGDPEASTAHAVIGPISMADNAIQEGKADRSHEVIDSSIESRKTADAGNANNAEVEKADLKVEDAWAHSSSRTDEAGFRLTHADHSTAGGSTVSHEDDTFVVNAKAAFDYGIEPSKPSNENDLLTGDFTLDSTSQVDVVSSDSEPLLAVDGLADESDRDKEEPLGSPQQNITPPGTDAVASGVSVTAADGFLDSEAHDAHEKGSFYRRCDEISDQYMLSKREREVLPLLAKGHNAAFIQDKLCVSKSTAKTHINHIYKKLDIHTQQELLNMVEDRQRGPMSSDGNETGASNGSNNMHNDSKKHLGNNYMLDKNAYEKALNEAAMNPSTSRPKPKRGYRTSIFSD